ncbi:MAG: nucleoside phosphorylase [Actinomycetota bacterium]|nr:nucleoside phosphorylase [Actinomycetota bacterium]
MSIQESSLRRRLATASLAVTLLAALLFGIALPAGAFASAGPASPSQLPSPHHARHARLGAAALAPIGIIDAFGAEEAPILAEMHVRQHVDIDGFRFWVGTLAGVPVVNVASGEVDETAELATYILDTRFHPRAVLFSGTAGAQNAAVHVGDVVVSGFVVDKSSIHYYLGGYQDGYSGEEVGITRSSDIRGDSVVGYGTPLPTPSDASSYGYGPSTADKKWVFVGAFAAPEQLLAIATKASSLLGTTTVADATGNPKATGTIANKVVAGVIGQADVWTEPLSWIEAQNMLYQTDAEENEGSGFAFMNTQLGVAWLLVRGISDSVWYPNAYDGLLSSKHAAVVVRYLVQHIPAVVSKAPATLADLSRSANAVRAGYLIAKRAYFTVSSVPKVVYVSRSGRTVTLTGTALKKLEQEYTYAAGRIG